MSFGVTDAAIPRLAVPMLSETADEGREVRQV
jgi:hypothetical protein